MTVNVESAGADILETDPSAHVDVDRSSENSRYRSRRGVEPGDHLQHGWRCRRWKRLLSSFGRPCADSFVIDGQPISDQQSKVFSTQLPTSAIQSMEVTTGNPGRRIRR